MKTFNLMAKFFIYLLLIPILSGCVAVKMGDILPEPETVEKTSAFPLKVKVFSNNKKIFTETKSIFKEYNIDVVENGNASIQLVLNYSHERYIDPLLFISYLGSVGIFPGRKDYYETIETTLVVDEVVKEKFAYRENIIYYLSLYSPSAYLFPGTKWYMQDKVDSEYFRNIAFKIILKNIAMHVYSLYSETNYQQVMI